jgi:hypothetical protein
MVRAILALLKRMTRRVVNKLRGFGNITEFGPSDTAGYDWHFRDKRGLWNDISHARLLESCPYGKVGDRLWVKETFYAFGHWETRFSAKKGRDEWHFVDQTLAAGYAYRFAADEEINAPLFRQSGALPMWWKRPAIFMPSDASRITLEVTDVRVERLQGITHEDAIAEGCIAKPFPGPWWQGYRDLGDGELNHEQSIGEQPPDWMIEPKPMKPMAHLDRSARDEYRSLWNELNGVGSWDANCWVWVVEFKRVDSVAIEVAI